MHRCDFCNGSGDVGHGLTNSLNVTDPCPICGGLGKIPSPYPKNGTVYVVDTGTEVLMARFNYASFIEFNPCGPQPENPRQIWATDLVGWG